MNYETTIATHNARIARMVESTLWDKANTLTQSDARKEILGEIRPCLRDLTERQREVQPDELREFVGRRTTQIMRGHDHDR